jgi:RNA methyltransferase, TrmH family
VSQRPESGHDAPVSEADEQALIRRFRTARRDSQLAVLEGFHALKHALRFGAQVLEAVASDPRRLRDLGAELAPDLGDALAECTTQVSAALVAELVPQAPRTGVVAIARRPGLDLAAVLAGQRPEPLVLLEDPRTMGNMGACVRVAAAADAAGVLTTGPNDPWHPDALRGAAGLHFALPVASLAEVSPPGKEKSLESPAGGEKALELLALAVGNRPLVAIDPGGADLRPAELPPRAILAFGTERYGLSAELLERADARLGIPMRAGVSSLNLATAVAAVLFARRL